MTSENSHITVDAQQSKVSSAGEKASPIEGWVDPYTEEGQRIIRERLEDHESMRTTFNAYEMADANVSADDVNDN